MSWDTTHVEEKENKTVRQTSASSWERFFFRVQCFPSLFLPSIIFSIRVATALLLLFSKFPLLGGGYFLPCALVFSPIGTGAKQLPWGWPTTALLGLPQGLWKLWPAKLMLQSSECKPTFKQQIEGPWPVGHEECTMVNVCLDAERVGWSWVLQLKVQWL